MPGILEYDSDLQKIAFSARHVAKVTLTKAKPNQVEVLWNCGKVESLLFVEDSQAEEFRVDLIKAMKMPET